MKPHYECPIERNHNLEAKNDCFACEAYKLITSLIGMLRRFGHENSALWGEKYLQEIYGTTERH